MGVVHLHGSLHAPRCLDCGAAYELTLAVQELSQNGQRLDPPRCEGCNGLIRPGVVWFGEMLPERAWKAGLAAAEDCDLFLSIGTSGMVFPAAELPLRALGKGATVVHINPEPFEVSADEHFLQGAATQMMQSLITAAFE